MGARVVGVDLDNTIICYDRALHRLAARAGLIPADAPADKRAIRDRVRALPNGETHWQRLQAELYGPSIDLAEPAEGAEAFLIACRQAGASVYVISHKTRLASLDATGTDLRSAATGWLASQGLFDPAGAGLAVERVFYEDTREAKIARIASLGCTHYVDDLVETFQSPLFPAGVAGVLYCPHGPPAETAGAVALRSFDAVRRYVLDER